MHTDQRGAPGRPKSPQHRRKIAEGMRAAFKRRHLQYDVAVRLLGSLKRRLGDLQPDSTEAEAVSVLADCLSLAVRAGAATAKAAGAAGGPLREALAELDPPKLVVDRFTVLDPDFDITAGANSPFRTDAVPERPVRFSPGFTVISDDPERTALEDRLKVLEDEARDVRAKLREGD